MNPTWRRHDWRRFIRHDAHRFLTPAAIAEEKRAAEAERAAQREADEAAVAAEHEEFERELLQVRRDLTALKFELALRRIFHKYSPDQPRVPAGSPDGGQWTRDAGKEGRENDKVSRSAVAELSSAHRPGFSRSQGHHYVPKSVYRSLPLAPETRKAFDEATTGPLRAARHGWSTEHDQYNQAVGQHLERFMSVKGIQPEQITADQAREFVAEVKRSTDPRIRNFNNEILKREFRHLLRFGPRRGE